MLSQTPASLLCLLILSSWNTRKPSCQMFLANWSSVLAWFVHLKSECSCDCLFLTWIQDFPHKYSPKQWDRNNKYLFILSSLISLFGPYFGIRPCCLLDRGFHSMHQGLSTDAYLTWLSDIKVLRNATDLQGYVKRIPFPFYFCCCFAFSGSHATLADLDFFKYS